MTDLHFIYKITHSDSGRFYIGRTDNPAKRWKCHNRQNGSRIIGRIIKKYGKKNITYQIIDSATFPEIKGLEQAYLDAHFNDNLNVNISDSCLGCSKGSEHSKNMVKGLKAHINKDPESWAQQARDNSAKSRDKAKEWYDNPDNKAKWLVATTEAQRRYIANATPEELEKKRQTAINNSKKSCQSKITLLTWSGIIIDEFESIKDFENSVGHYPPKGINRKANQFLSTQVNNWTTCEIVANPKKPNGKSFDNSLF